MRRLLWIAACVTLCVSSGASAQDEPADSAAAAAVAGPDAPASSLTDSLPEGIAPFVAVNAPTVALQHVTVVDGTGKPAREDQTVLIEDGRIAAVGDDDDVRVPDRAHVLELPGHTVIPGIVGLHDHTFYTTARRTAQLNFSAPRLYLASGVTTIRTTGSYCPYCELNLKREIAARQVPGPRIHATGPYLNSTGSGDDVILASPEDARRVVGYWADEGVSWFKAYAGIRRAELKAVIDEAHRRGLKVTGHLCAVSFREAVALGIDNLEHGLFTNSDWVVKEPDRCPDDLIPQLARVDVQSEDVRRTIREMVEAGVALTTTLPIYELAVPERQLPDERLTRLLAPEALQEYQDTRAEIRAIADTSEWPFTSVFAKAQAFEKAFHDAGGLLAAGVDPTGIGGALPGLGDQRNFELLREGGFSPEEAVQVMTLNGARVLGEEELYGSIEPGKLAELVVLEGDLAADPTTIRNVRFVFRDGLGYDPEKLLESVAGEVGRR